MSTAVKELFVPTFSNLSLNLFENTLDEHRNRIALHWHERLEIIHVIEGEGMIDIDFQEYHIHAQDLVIVPPSALHSVRGYNHQLITSQTVVFTLDCLPIHKTYEPVIHPGMPGYKEMLLLMNFIFQISAERPEKTELLFQGYLTALYGLLKFHNYERLVTNCSAASSQHIKDVIYYIHTHYQEKISIDTLAETAGYSKYYFVRYFSRYVGCTCSQYIQSIRLEKAKKMLKSTNLSISDISESTGFESVSYFIKIFRKQEGETPLQYRRRWLT